MCLHAYMQRDSAHALPSTGQSLVCRGPPSPAHCSYVNFNKCLTGPHQYVIPFPATH